MANSELLLEKLKKSGVPKAHLARALNVTRPTLYRLLEHPDTCTFSQADIIVKELHIDDASEVDEIFLV